MNYIPHCWVFVLWRIGGRNNLGIPLAWERYVLIMSDPHLMCRHFFPTVMCFGSEGWESKLVRGYIRFQYAQSPLVEVGTTFLRKLRIESWTPFVIFWYTKSENMGIIVESLVILFGTRNQRWMSIIFFLVKTYRFRKAKNFNYNNPSLFLMNDEWSFLHFSRWMMSGVSFYKHTRWPLCSMGMKL